MDIVTLLDITSAERDRYQELAETRGQRIIELLEEKLALRAELGEAQELARDLLERALSSLSLQGYAAEYDALAERYPFLKEKRPS